MLVSGRCRCAIRDRRPRPLPAAHVPRPDLDGPPLAQPAPHARREADRKGLGGGAGCPRRAPGRGRQKPGRRRRLSAWANRPASAFTAATAARYIRRVIITVMRAAAATGKFTSGRAGRLRSVTERRRRRARTARRDVLGLREDRQCGLVGSDQIADRGGRGGNGEKDAGLGTTDTAAAPAAGPDRRQSASGHLNGEQLPAPCFTGRAAARAMEQGSAGWGLAGSRECSPWGRASAVAGRGGGPGSQGGAFLRDTWRNDSPAER